jgi:hypothetical protein
MFMHIGGMGDEEKLASAVGKVFAKIKETSGGKGQIPMADLDPGKTSLDPKNIESVIGTKGQMANGVYKITIGRTTKMNGHTVGNAMGINTWAAFVGSDQQAVVDGDFVMLEKETESPRVVFLHYWGVGPTSDLAKGLKAALDTQKKS